MLFILCKLCDIIVAERNCRNGRDKMKMKKRCLAVIIAGILVVLAIAAVALVRYIGSNTVTIAVTPAGEREFTLEYGSVYGELGAVAIYSDSRGNTAPAEVTVRGTVDTHTVGTYTVAYIASYGDHIGTAYRYVHIVDTQEPTITLTADPDYYTLPGHIYAEEGFTATDDYDGDITARVQRKETPEAVTYTVSDSSGNTTTVTRPIVYSDPIPPQIQLSGGAEVTMLAGREFYEPGYTATDNCDGDLTGKVTVSHNVDALHPGTYSVTYSVTDAFGNTASVTRTVHVKAWPQPQIRQPQGKVIYLTFDDGPGEYTPELLDVLKKYNVKATFFVVNTKKIDTITRIAQEGHTIGIHTATHVFEDVYSSEEAYFADLYRMQDVIFSYTGQRPTLLRFPGGSSNTISQFNPGIMTRLTQLVTAHGFRYFDWNVDSDDAGRAQNADKVYRNVISGIEEHEVAVVLQHDTKHFSIQAVEAIIQWGLANGYRFLPLSSDSPECHHPIMN